MPHFLAHFSRSDIDPKQKDPDNGVSLVALRGREEVPGNFQRFAHDLRKILGRYRATSFRPIIANKNPSFCNTLRSVGYRTRKTPTMDILIRE